MSRWEFVNTWAPTVIAWAIVVGLAVFVLVHA